MGFLKSLFGNSDVPQMSSYSEIFDVVLEPGKKSRNDFKKIMKQAAVLNVPPTERDIYMLHPIANWLFVFKEFKDTKAVCDKILKIDPKNCQARRLMLEVAFAENDRQPMSLCDDLLESDYLQFIEETKVTLESSIPAVRNMRKHMADLFMRVGGIFMDANNLEKAKKANEIAFAIDPTFFEAHTNIGIVLYNLKRYNEAIESFKKDLDLLEEKRKMYPDSPETRSIHNKYLLKVYLNIGKAFYRLDQTPEARRYIEKSISLDERYRNKPLDKTVNEVLYTLKTEDI